MLLALFPGLLYVVLLGGYRRILLNKRKTIEAILKGDTLEQFIRAYGSELENPDEIIKELFDRYYHPRMYRLPVSILFLVLTAATAMSLVRLGLPLGLPNEFVQLIQGIPPTAFAGVAGAFAWGMYDSFGRYRLRDLTPASLHFVWLRISITPALAFFLAEAFVEPASYLVALGVGAFPTKTLTDFLQRQAKDRLKLEGGAVQGEEPQLHNLQGLTPEVIGRLEEEGLSSVEHLANTDPFTLLLSTSYEWKTVPDFVDQAILFNYIGEKLAELRPVGIRGAIELAEIGEQLESDDPTTVSQAQKMVAIVCSKLGQEPEAVENLIKTIHDDVQVDFIWTVWGETRER